MKSTASTITLALAALMATPSAAAVRPAARPALQRLLESQLSAPRFKTELSKRFGLRGSQLSEQSVHAVLRFDSELDAARLRRLEQRGVRFERLDGAVAHVGGFYGVRAQPEVLAALLDEPDLQRLLPPRPAMIPPSPLNSPFGKVHELTTARDLWPRRDEQGRPITGAGVVICDIDGATDLFHPMFFRPDAGLYAWIDVNDDGLLTPDVDAVDLDGDGVAGEGELLRRLGGDVVDLYYGQVIDQARGFHAARQWLYADVDGSGMREFGPARGFREDDPAYGEPLFLIDDVDRDGNGDPGEKLLRLGSSKYKGIFRVASGQVYERGVDLISMPINPDAGHGTGVGGILAGGEYGRTFVHGVATDAELLLIDQGMTEAEYRGYDEDAWSASLVSAFAWAQGHDAQVFVHEYGTPVGEFADGSSDWEQLLDQLTADGSVQTTATHNFADNLGHAELSVPALGQLEVPFETYDLSMWGYPIYMLQGTLRWREPTTTLSATLVTPAGVEIPLDGERWEADDYSYATTDLSPRGTGMIDFYYARVDGGSGYPEDLPVGSWTLRIANSSASAVDAYLALTDDTGYSMAVAIGVQTTQLGTIAHPATADSAISVGASVGNYVDEGEQAEGIKRYSGRGPRIDGEFGVDVVAPEDHYTAAPDSSGAGGVDYMSFGGTSGALPQVAGAVALLLQAEPELSPAEVKARLHDAGGEDGLTGAVPNPEWGFGRLAVHQLVTGEPPLENQAPLAVLTLPATVEVGAPLLLDASASSDAEDAAAELRYGFDVGYDGAMEVEGFEHKPEVSFDTPGEVWIKVEVQDSRGATAAALAMVEVVEKPAAAHDVACGCAQADTRTGMIGALLLLGLLAARRRQPTTENR